MFKKMIQSVSETVANKIKSGEATDMIRSEVTSLLKQMLFRYFIVMNLVFGVVGFVTGVILTLVIH